MFRKINIINMKVAKHLISLFLILFCITINSFGVEKGYRDTGKTFYKTDSRSIKTLNLHGNPTFDRIAEHILYVKEQLPDCYWRSNKYPEISFYYTYSIVESDSTLYFESISKPINKEDFEHLLKGEKVSQKVMICILPCNRPNFGYSILSTTRYNFQVGKDFYDMLKHLYAYKRKTYSYKQKYEIYTNGTDTISRPTIAVCWGAEIRLLYNEDSSIELYSYDCTDMFTF